MVKICTEKRWKHRNKYDKIINRNATRKSPRLLNKLIIYSNNNKTNLYSSPWVRYQHGGHIDDITSIQHLPNEILIHIFQYLSINDLWNSVRLVCRQWEDLSKCHCLWETIEANGDISSEVLQEWLRIASSLKCLKLTNRKDADLIIEQASKYNKRLETIEARDCWGSNFRRNVKSKPLCNLLKRCPMLSNINFDGTSFISCQFYKLMAKHNTMHSIKKRKRKNMNNKVHPINYCGGANGRQIKAFLLARKDSNPDYLAHLLFEGLGDSHLWRLTDDYEVIQNVQNRQPEPHQQQEQIGFHQHDGNEVDVEVRMNEIDMILEYIGLL